MTGYFVQLVSKYFEDGSAKRLLVRRTNDAAEKEASAALVNKIIVSCAACCSMLRQAESRKELSESDSKRLESGSQNKQILV